MRPVINAQPVRSSNEVSNLNNTQYYHFKRNCSDGTQADLPRYMNSSVVPGAVPQVALFLGSPATQSQTLTVSNLGAFTFTYRVRPPASGAHALHVVNYQCIVTGSRSGGKEHFVSLVTT